LRAAFLNSETPAVNLFVGVFPPRDSGFGGSLMRSVERKLALIFSAVLVFTCTAAKAGDSRETQKPVFKVGVDTVFLKVSVTDPLNRSVTGLSKEDFKVYEDKVEQEILTFSQEPSPVSIGILLDVSGSMKTNNNIQAARAALKEVLQTVNLDDEFFLMAFNHNVTLVSDFTNNPAALLSEGALKQPSGQTAIWDAVYRGLDKMKSAKNEKKAMILITDGEDNSSRYTSLEVREFARESDAQIYAIGEPGELGYGPAEIQEIVQMTGGRAFFPNDLNSLDYYIDLIQSELRNQYVLSYVPTRKDHDGKWRKIQVKLDQLEGLPKLIVHTREGYYLSKN
jgi:Ca-activated chloride channel family protein